MICSFANRECAFYTNCINAGVSPKVIVDTCEEVAGELIPGVSIVRCAAFLARDTFSLLCDPNRIEITDQDQVLPDSQNIFGRGA